MKKLWELAVLLTLVPCLPAQGPNRRVSNTDVHIGVLGLFHAQHVVVQPWAGRSLVCQAGGQRLAANASLSLELKGKNISIGNQAGQWEAVHCDDGQGNPSEFLVLIPGKISRRYFGELDIKPSAAQVLIIVSMDLETAVASVVAAESPPGAPMEALKAQAVASRSFLVAGKGRHRDFDFCDTTHCQFLRAPPSPNAPAAQATSGTAGLILTYKGRTVAALYSSSCGGRSHSLEELGIPVRDYPYFSVPCPYCLRHPQRWVSRIEESDASALTRTEQSRLALARKLGWKMFPSNSYLSRHEGGSVILEGVGVGHGIGLCQRGAADMARNGASFLEILEHYYPNTAVQKQW